jgi:biotin carboxyl carrier protein
VTFDVDVRGRRHHVEVVRTANGDRVSVDGRVFTSHVAGAPPFWSLLVEEGEPVAGTSPYRSYEVAFDMDASTGTLAVNLDGSVVPVRLVDRRRARPQGGVGDDRTGAQSLRAPMPGRIVRVLVAPGDRVVARQPLVVMEAMKMENELHAALGGTVTDVRVEAGSTVEAGALLLVVTSQIGTKA